MRLKIKVFLRQTSAIKTKMLILQPLKTKIDNINKLT